MKFWKAWALAIFCAFSSLTYGQDTLTEQQYLDRLQGYLDQLALLKTAPENAVRLRDSAPFSLTVQTTSGDFTVDTKFLHDGLNRFLTADAKVKPQILLQLSDRLQALEDEGHSYYQPSRADETTRSRLESILNSREFSRVSGPSALDRLKERIGEWIWRLLRKVNPKIPDVENAGQIFVWTVIGLAAAIAAVWLYRLSRQNLEGGKREIMPFLPSSRSWQEWLSQAREQAAIGNWRDAIHFGFWAAVSRLESDGIWPPDKARTPREYLSSIPSSNLSREPFAALTRKFEASWYGGRPTTSIDFEQFAQNLERLGCR